MEHKDYVNYLKEEAEHWKSRAYKAEVLLLKGYWSQKDMASIAGTSSRYVKRIIDENKVLMKTNEKLGERIVSLTFELQQASISELRKRKLEEEAKMLGAPSLSSGSYNEKR